MTLDEAREHWRRERARLEAINAWIDGFAGNVMQLRNDLIHRGFAGTMPHDLEKLHVQLSGAVSAFRA